MFATASVAYSLASRAIFWASITSPGTRCPERHNTPAGPRGTVLAQLLNVGAGAKMNAVLFPAGAAYHVKIAESIELGALLGRQPGSEKPQPLYLGRVLLTSDFVQPAEGPLTSFFR